MTPHQSKTGQDANLYRKSTGGEARLSYMMSLDFTQSPKVTAAKVRDLAEGGYI